jgi:hypothetical protein
MRLLRGYGRDEARAWWRAVAAAHGALAVRDAAHLLRTATRDSRRFVRVAAAGVTGWARRDGPLAEALSALEARERGGESLWITALGRLDRPAPVWAAALVLAQRGAAPPPVAFLCRDGGCFLVAERVAGARSLAAAEPGRARAALVGLLDRLLAFGFEPSALVLESVVLTPGPSGATRAQLLDPRGLRPGRASRGAPGAREWAARLLARRPG